MARKLRHIIHNKISVTKVQVTGTCDQTIDNYIKLLMSGETWAYRNKDRSNTCIVGLDVDKGRQCVKCKRGKKRDEPKQEVNQPKPLFPPTTDP